VMMTGMHARIPYSRCPLCDGLELRELRTADCSSHPSYKPSLPAVMRWVECVRCAHVMTDGYFDDAALRDLFADALPWQTPGHDVAPKRFTSATIVERLTALRGQLPSGAWLDVGFGDGSLLTTAAEFGYEAVGLDARASSVEKLRAFGIEAHVAELETFATDRRFAVISMADVLEHLPFPRRALLRARTLLADDGLLFVSMPNSDSFLWKSLDEAGKNPYWAELEHLHNFGRRRLYALLEEHGFSPRQYAVSTRYLACMEVIASKR